jgi:hypothetical protein
VASLAVSADACVHGVQCCVRALHIRNDGAPSVLVPTLLNIPIKRQRVADIGSLGSPKRKLMSPPLIGLLLLQGRAACRVAVGDGCLAGRKTALGSDMAGSDTPIAVSEDPGRDEVEEAEGNTENAGGEHDTPHRKAELVDAGRGLIEVSQDLTAHDNHGDAEPAQPMLGREHRPVPLEVFGKKVHLREDEKDGDGTGEEVGGGVEEEKAVGDACHDNHDPARHANYEEADDIKGSEDVEDQVARAPERSVLGESRHCCCSYYRLGFFFLTLACVEKSGEGKVSQASYLREEFCRLPAVMSPCMTWSECEISDSQILDSFEEGL